MKREKYLVGALVGVILLFLLGQVIVGKFTVERKEEGHSVIEVVVATIGETERDRLESWLSKSDHLIWERFEKDIALNRVDERTAKERFRHMQRVSYIVVDLLRQYEEIEGVSFSKEEREDLMLAGYLHDICKYEENSHAKEGAKYVRETLSEVLGLSSERVEHIANLIRYHSKVLSDKQKEQLGEQVLFAQLLQDADTIDKVMYKNKKLGVKDKALNLKSSEEYIK